MRQASRELCLRGVNGLTAEACHRVGEPPARPRTPAPQPRYRPACRRGGPPRRRQTGLASLRHRPYGLYHVRPALLRRGCHIHVGSATWLGHPRRILPGPPGGRRAPPVTAARPEPSSIGKPATVPGRAGRGRPAPGRHPGRTGPAARRLLPGRRPPGRPGAARTPGAHALSGPARSGSAGPAARVTHEPRHHGGPAACMSEQTV